MIEHTKQAAPGAEAPQGWTTYSACACVEGFDGEEHDEAEVLAAWQHLINTGVVWQLQGFYGRTAANLIEQGLCSPRSN